MGTSTSHVGANAGAGNENRTRQTTTGEGRVAPRLTSEQVWQGLAQASFAVSATSPRPGSRDPAAWWTRPSGGVHGAAIVHPAGSPQASALVKKLGSLIPKQRRTVDSSSRSPRKGAFLTYGVGVPLLTMLDVTAALARVPVTTEGGT
jgi:hypothetical protein